MQAAIIMERSGNVYYKDPNNVLKWVPSSDIKETAEELALVASRLGVLDSQLKDIIADHL